MSGAEPLCLLNYPAGYPITLVTLSMAKTLAMGIISLTILNAVRKYVTKST